MTAKNNSSRGRQEREAGSDAKKRESSSSTSGSYKGKSKDKNFRPHPEKIKSFKKGPSKLKKTSDSDEIRLNKYIANSGICSRREADTYISAGSATVNGKIITEMG